jgi:hypothetical protein
MTDNHDARDLARAVLEHEVLAAENARMWRYDRDPGDDRIQAEELAHAKMLRLARAALQKEDSSHA